MKLVPLQSCVHRPTLKQLIVDLVVDCISLMSKEIKYKYLLLMYNKGEDNGTGASVVELLLFWDDLRNKVVVRYFGIEQAGNISKDAAIAIDHSLKLFDYSLPNKVKFSSSMTDADGSGVGSSLVMELNDDG